MRSTVAEVLSRGARIAAVILTGAATASRAQVPPRPSGTARTIAMVEGTDIAATVSPDRRNLILAMHGALWALPIGGGQARPLTDTMLDPARPDWSPRGDRVAFESYFGGTFHIWTMQPDGADIRQLTRGHGDDREPRFSPDGTKVAFSSDRAFRGTYDIWVADLATGKLTQRTSGPNDAYEPAWSPDGSEIAYVSGAGAYGARIQAVSAAGVVRTLAVAEDGTHVESPSWSPNGRQIAYTQLGRGESRLLVSGSPIKSPPDVFPFPATWTSNSELLYTADGRIWASRTDRGSPREIPFRAEIALHRPPYRHKRFSFDSAARRDAKGIVSPALSPDGKRLVFEALNQLWLMEIGKEPCPLTHDSYYKEDPAWSPDGTRIVYSSDKAGTEDLYVLDLATKTERRITSADGSAEIGAAWSPDGKEIAFQDQTGATFVVELATGEIWQVIEPQFEPSRPSWSADGKAIAISVVKPYTRRFREGTNQILVANIETGDTSYAEPAPFQSISMRGEDGPVYSPDGSAVAFVMNSVLWIRPVNSEGVPSGPALQINHEVTDAPTWSKDSKHILYLSNGKLRLTALDGSPPRTVPLRLFWRREQTREATLIHAGKLWNGLGAEEQTNFDILVENNRIRFVAPHREEAHQNARLRDIHYVDASALTVIPGLWDSHTHQWISGQYYGDRIGRLWLAYGVTSLHSQGDPAYRAVETREAFASGARVGPRFFATGEPIDGERVYYGFMRPTTSDAQLALELSRARALGYDSLKTYVRLPLAMQARAMRFAHKEMGVVTLSHSMLPGISYGMDGMTHIAGTSRYGFSYTRSADGISYAGMRSLFGLSGAFDISTPFFSCALYAEDPAMVDDRRLVALNTPWDEAALRAKRDRMIAEDQAATLDALRHEEDALASIVRSGGMMLAGSDSPLDNVATALLLNLRAQVKFGLPPWQALQTATLFPARAFGVDEDLGSIEPGKLADMVFLSGDPLRDIKDLANVASVMKNGKLYSTAELTAPFEASRIASIGRDERP